MFPSPYGDVCLKCCVGIAGTHGIAQGFRPLTGMFVWNRQRAPITMSRSGGWVSVPLRGCLFEMNKMMCQCFSALQQFPSPYGDVCLKLWMCSVYLSHTLCFRPLTGMFVWNLENCIQDEIESFRPLTGMFVWNFYCDSSEEEERIEGFRPLTGMFVWNYQMVVSIKKIQIPVSVPLRGCLFEIIRWL